MFSSIQNDSATRGSWGISLAVHGLVVTSLVLAPFLFPESLDMAHALDKYNLTALIAPLPVTKPPEITQLRLPAAIPQPKVAPPPRELALRDPVLPQPVMPAMEVRKESPPPPPPLKLEIALPPQPQPLAPLAPSPPPPPARAVVTGVLADKNPDTPPLNKPARDVQTGGFGDPNGVSGEGRASRAVTIPRVGAFELPAGPGTGNGTGGARGSQGVVASAGFSNATASANSSTRAGSNAVTSAGFSNATASGNSSTRAGSNAVVQQGAFNDARPDQTAQARPARPASAAETPAEVTFKPKPEYTEEARKARDEGEVLVRVAFAATGKIRVLEVVKGLPHGLNEAALRAAEQIQFKPATKDGKPVDSVAVVHINFQLAY